MSRALAALLLLCACHRPPTGTASPIAAATSPATPVDAAADRFEGPAAWSALDLFVAVPAGWTGGTSARGGLQLEHAKSGVVVRVVRGAAGPSEAQAGETLIFLDAGRFRRVPAIEPTGTTSFRRADGSLRLEWWTEQEDGVRIEIVSQPGKALRAITLAEEILHGLQVP